MLFKFIEKPIVIDCFTDDPFAFEHAKITNARKIIPEWWKELPDETSRQTLKACKGFTGYYNNSFYLPSWVRINFEMGSVHEKSCVWQASGPVGLEIHQHHQFHGFVDKNYHLFKISSPWYLKTKSKINFLVSDPVWNRQGVHNIITLPGVIQFYNQFETNFNFMIEYRERPRNVDIMIGDPLMFFTPISEKKIVLKHHQISVEESDKFKITHRFFLEKDFGRIPRLKIRNDYLEKNKEESKCPFGFGKK